MTNIIVTFINMLCLQKEKWEVLMMNLNLKSIFLIFVCIF